jgi:hypothetical protein
MLPTWEHFHRVKLDLPSNKSDIYLRIWADFFWNFGLGDERKVELGGGRKKGEFGDIT